MLSVCYKHCWPTRLKQEQGTELQYGHAGAALRLSVSSLQPPGLEAQSCP